MINLEHQQPLIKKIKKELWKGASISKIVENYMSADVSEEMLRQIFAFLEIKDSQVKDSLEGEAQEEVFDSTGSLLPFISMLPDTDNRLQTVDSSNDRIFVTISAYKEPLLRFTLEQAWTNAKHPSRITFGIVEQDDRSIRDLYPNDPWMENTQIAHFLPIDARGACWARAIGFSLYRDQKYIMQIDSHMAFDQDWDETFISQLENIQQRLGHDRAILTAYPPVFSINDETGEVSKSPFTACTVMRPKITQEIGDDDVSFGFEGMVLGNEYQNPILGFHIAGGFFFAPGYLVNEVPYDPWMYFLGEEQSFAIRSWTSGWDIVHPVKVPLYHLYRKSDHQDDVHWTEDVDKQRRIRWWEHDKRSKARLAKMINEQVHEGNYGMGRDRTLQDYANVSGIDYINKKITHFYRNPSSVPAPTSAPIRDATS